MYKVHFGLQRDPFGMTPDPRVLHMTVAQREALAGIMYAILARRGFVALIGEAGTGKTTLLNKLMTTLQQTQAQFSVVFNPTLTTGEFLESALADFGVTDIPKSKTQRLLTLHKLLLSADERNVLSVLVVDEAHKLSADVLEEIRLLSNFERPGAKLLQIILAGQQQLAGILDRPELQQLKQRVAVRLTIGRFSGVELKAYLSLRWIAAGGKQHPFTPAAVQLITSCSSGIPRVVNAICDNALMLAMAEGATVVSDAHVEEAARDLSFAPEPSEVAPRVVKHAPAAAESPEKAQTIMVAPAKEQPEAAKLPEAPIHIPLLERYAPAPSNGSALSRLLGRIGWANN